MLKVTFNPSVTSANYYPDLILISPDRAKDWYDYERFRRDRDGDGNGTNADGSYTGYTSNPEVMEIYNPASGTWIIAVYPQDEGDISYTLEATIVKSAGETIPG